MTVQADAGADSGLSMDQAVGLLTRDDVAEAPEAQEAPEGAAEEIEQSEAGDDPASDAEESATGDDETEAGAETGDGEEESTEAAEAEGEQPQPSRAPQHWNGEERAVFDSLPTAAQDTVLRHERARVAASTRAFQEATRLGNEANASMQRAADLAARAQAAIQAAPGLDQEFIPGVTDPNGQPMTWAQLDWDAAERSDPTLAGALRATYNDRAQKRDARLNALAQSAREAQDKADSEAFNAYLASEQGKLQQLNPKLAEDSPTGQAKRAAIGEWLITQGIPPNALRGIGAVELTLAEKAMRWDLLQAKAQAASKPGQQPPRTPNKAPSKTVRPSAAAPSAPSQKRATAEANNRFAQTRSIDDAVALVLARRSG